MAIVLSVSALLAPRSALAPAVRCSFVGTAVVIDSASGEALQAGIQQGDRLLAIDGAAVPLALRGATERWVLGERNVYRIRTSGGEIREFALEPVRRELSQDPTDFLIHLGLLLVSISYLVIGMVVWWSKSTAVETWAMMLFCSTMSVLISAAVRVHLSPWSASLVLVNMPWLGAATFHLFTTYPIEPQWIVRHRQIRALPYVAAFAISASVLIGELAGYWSPWLQSGAFLYGVVLAVVSLGILVTERRSAREAGVGDRAGLMLLAGVLSLLPVLVVMLMEYFLALSLPWYLAMMWVVFFPATVGYGMLRRQLFDFRIIAKSSAAYGAVSLAITGLYAFVITSADAIFPEIGVDARSVQVAFLFLAILAVYPLRDRMQRLVDTFFDRDRSLYRSALREISDAMVSMLSQREISDRIAVAVTETMGARSAMVLLVDESEKALVPVAWRGEWEGPEIEISIASDHPIWKQMWMRREELARGDFDEEVDAEQREACWDIFDSLHVELLVPILYGVDLRGMVAVGRKISGDRLGTDDRQLLRTLANNSAIAIENARAFDEIAQLNETLEARVDERTRELREIQDQLMQSEKMRSLGQMVAGVAHELNNPIGFVHANLKLLDEFVPRLEQTESGEERDKVRDAIDKLLSRSREGTNRMKQIVMDLRSFSRLDQAELQDANLHEEIDRTLALMEPRLKGDIRVEREYGELPEVRCYPGQLNQVFLNLLMNACDVLEVGGTITISTRRTDRGVRLDFHDDGPGIPANVQSRLFDPFFTTKPVGQGTGLGLSLAHRTIDRHGGRIQVDSEAGRGTSFIIDLPLDATPAPELES
ncbi:MAG: ATP-binding protein [Myxococcota bacterium]|nr:ATP-binding protein [Myxococcota bacterium]